MGHEKPGYMRQEQACICWGKPRLDMVGNSVRAWILCSEEAEYMENEKPGYMRSEAWKTLVFPETIWNLKVWNDAERNIM